MDDAASVIGYLIGFVIAAAIAIWVATDANKRGMNGVGWGIGVFLFCIVVLPIYLITRKPLLAQPTGYPYGGPPQPYVPPQQPYVPPQQPYVPPPQNYVPPPQNWTPAPPVPPTSTAPPQTGHNFCAKCGARLSPDAKFCAACGNTV